MYKESQLRSLVEGRRILIAGYGREGKSTHGLLQRLLPGEEVEVACNDEEIYAALERKQYDLVIKSPGISMMKLEGRCNVDTVTSQSDLFLQVYGSQTVAVTGTKGKSTTTSLLWHLLRGELGIRNEELGVGHTPQSLRDSSPNLGEQQAAANHRNEELGKRNVVLAGNMGIPLFDILDELDEESLIVAEMSCHQLENIHRGPHIGILLNLYQEHLDHYHDYRGYQMAKMQMVLRQQEGDHCLYCTDSPDLEQLVSGFKDQISSTLHPYSLEEAKRSEIAQWPTTLKGDHNLSNIYAAVQAARLAVPEIPLSSFKFQVSSFKGLPHRLELVGTYHGITFYNDSISTIPEATIAAMGSLKEVNTLILGGFDRGIDYGTLYSFLASPKADKASLTNLVFVGKAGRRMYETMRQMDHSPLERMTSVLVEDDYDTIVRHCYRVTAQGKICLLSPAAASYDAFKNFEERGETFVRLIRKYA